MGPHIKIPVELLQYNKNLEMDPQKQNEQIHYWLTEANTTPAEVNKPLQPLPAWVNPQLIKEGQDFVRRNFFIVMFAHLVSLIFLLCYSPVRIVLILTSYSDTKPKALKRYLSTALHIKDWYEGELLEFDGSASMDVQRIRKIHTGVAGRLNRQNSTFQVKKEESTYAIPDADSQEHEKLKNAITNTALAQQKQQNNSSLSFNSLDSRQFAMTQLDMAITQFCFMGFIALLPKKLGIVDLGGVRGFVHVWALIGHLLGIEDRFNVALDQNAHMRPIILYDILMGELRHCHADTVTLWKSLIGAFEDIVPMVSLEAVLLLVFSRVLKISKTDDLRGCLNYFGWTSYGLMYFAIIKLTPISMFRIIFNFLLRVAIYWAKKVYLPHHGKKSSQTIHV